MLWAHCAIDLCSATNASCRLLAVADELAGRGLALEQGGDADGGEDRRACCIEKPGVDAVDKGVAGVGAGRPTGVDGDGEGGPCLVDERSRGAGKLQAGAVDGGDDAADDGRAECPADLAGEIVQRGAHPLLRLGQRLGDGCRGGRHGRAHADAERDETSQHQQVGGVRPNPRDDHEPGGDENEPGDADGAGAESRCQPEA